MAGTGSNSTQEALTLTRWAEKIGADAALIVAPYYNKPTQEGFYQHFKVLAEAVDIPICIYNIPGRTGKNIEPETIARVVFQVLAKHMTPGEIKHINLSMPHELRDLWSPETHTLWFQQ